MPLLEPWMARYAERAKPGRKAAMDLVNPKYVLRNYMAQEVIEQGGVQELLEVLRRPYDEQPGMERYAKRRPDWARHKPGCSALSCSS
jgi:uncharacterized protein YdiU (UPF0061 family)